MRGQEGARSWRGRIGGIPVNKPHEGSGGDHGAVVGRDPDRVNKPHEGSGVLMGIILEEWWGR